MSLRCAATCHCSHSRSPSFLTPSSCVRFACLWRPDVTSPPEQMSRRREREPPECVWVAPPPPDLECSVCSEVFTDPVTLACGHTFCRACAVSWFTTQAKRCPLGACPASAKSKPAKLPTQYVLKSMVDALRVRCRFGLCEDERGGWMPDPEGCPAQLSRADAAAHEASCEHASEACPFAGCGVLRRRRDADAHDTLMAVAHVRGERDARLALEARVRGERDARIDELDSNLWRERDSPRLTVQASARSRFDTMEANARDQQARLDAQQARLDALEARLAAVVPGAGAQHALLAAVRPAAANGSGAVRAVTGAARRKTLHGHASDVYVRVSLRLEPRGRPSRDPKDAYVSVCLRVKPRWPALTRR